MNKPTVIELAAWVITGVLGIVTLVLGALAAAASTGSVGPAATAEFGIAAGALAPVLAAALVLSGLRMLLASRDAQRDAPGR